ncbi:hypothetical protein [Streptomyces sp. NPDC001508]|uniref:hypothetical protein n=1 Tax=Streptomyces sp. NPDC001508 TaxID=3154656 RepID=UPI0033180E9F
MTAIPSPRDLARRQPPKPTPPPAPSRHRPSRPAAAQAPATATEPEPTPAPPVTAADAIAPSRLREGERIRGVFESAIRISGMTPNTRLTALTLLSYANFRTGRIPTRREPSAEQLARATGLTASQVLVQLEILTQRGWLHRRAIKSGPRKGALVLDLAVPAAVLHQLRERAAQTAIQATASS